MLEMTFSNLRRTAAALGLVASTLIAAPAFAADIQLLNVCLLYTSRCV